MARAGGGWAARAADRALNPDIMGDIARMRDLYVGLFKALIFGIVITGVSCYEGFTTRQGAVGVGQATRRSVITSFLLVLILGYIVTRMFYDL